MSITSFSETCAKKSQLNLFSIFSDIRIWHHYILFSLHCTSHSWLRQFISNKNNDRFLFNKFSFNAEIDKNCLFSSLRVEPARVELAYLIRDRCTSPSVTRMVPSKKSILKNWESSFVNRYIALPGASLNPLTTVVARPVW